MSRLSVRILLLIACLSAIGGAVFHLWSSDRRTRLDAASTRQFNAIARSAAVAALELRAAQQAYVAAGQGEEYWFDRVTAMHGDLQQQVTQLGTMAIGADARAALDAAAGALRDVAVMDRHVRDLRGGGALTAAADVIFTEGAELSRRAADAFARAATSEQVALDAAAARVQRTQIQALAGAAGVTVLGLVLLVPLAFRQAPAPAAAAQSCSARIVLPDFDEFRPPVRSVPKMEAAAAPAPSPPAAPAVDLGSVATLCNDFARVPDTRALPALLERTASVLDATGVIVWIADPDGRELAPILVHGYPPQLATRLGTIARDATNLTASAYRTGLLQSVKADAISSGAIAGPLLSATGCVGVMAAEVKNGGEQQEDLLAAATIVAAQLATLAGPPSARARAEAAS
jgi:hypothetical protein